MDPPSPVDARESEASQVTDPNALFGALSDPTRRKVFDSLVAHGPASATSLARSMPVSRQAVAKHLVVLEEAGLVERGVAGRESLFEARPEALEDVRVWIDRVGDQWDARLKRLQDRFE
jgi:ArsR family transcriptional regulator, cadmium/lead-responsive transcriptional repressor